jgi:hypothetical protein
MCDTVVALMAQGYSRAEVAVALGISYHTSLLRWEDLHPEFRDALKEGQERSQAWWEGMGRKSVHLPHGVKFQTGVWAMMMVNRFGYKSARTESKDVQERILKLDLSGLSDNQLEKLAIAVGFNYEPIRLPAPEDEPGGTDITL